MVYANAPIILGETSNSIDNHEGVDHILPVNFDGDYYAGNNSYNALNGNVSNGGAHVYFSISETGGSDYGYFFIGYYIYHPRDGGTRLTECQTWPACVQHSTGGHENDLEGLLMVVAKDGVSPYGTPMFLLDVPPSNQPKVKLTV